tara:strand:+ start:218 stop:460 length:243 start_codon:yes stop_codon:yes gene_type:complete
MSEIQCINKCGNLTVEGSEYCADCKTIKILEDTEKFVEQVFEIAFGNEAYQKGYSYEEVVRELRHFSDLALEKQQERGEI